MSIWGWFPLPRIQSVTKLEILSSNTCHCNHLGWITRLNSTIERPCLQTWKWKLQNEEKKNNNIGDIRNSIPRSSSGALLKEIWVCWGITHHIPLRFYKLPWPHPAVFLVESYAATPNNMCLKPGLALFPKESFNQGGPWFSKSLPTEVIFHYHQIIKSMDRNNLLKIRIGKFFLHRGSPLRHCCVASKVAPFHDATFFCAATAKEAIVWLVQARPGGGCGVGIWDPNRYLIHICLYINTLPNQQSCLEITPFLWGNLIAIPG